MPAVARLDLRLSLEDKDRVTRAAQRRGMPVSVFVRGAVLREAEGVIAAADTGAHSGSLAERLRGRATSRMSTEEIMRLTRGK
ncbi:MAG: DUF1778 domain-containing protein [Proteobacteria bacterium]|nr:DUF1778 domain-containing protein [Pseudomonadota bacterium]